MKTTLLKNPKALSIKTIKTPLGQMTAGCTDKGICLLEFNDHNELDKEIEELAKTLGCALKKESNNILKDLTEQLNEYFAGKRTVFNLKLFFVGTQFQKIVWTSLLKIPYGKTIAYKEQAASIKKPESIRAMAHANGMNKLSIIVPCHRVIGSDGSLTGYGGGLWRKRYLIDMERKFSGKPPLYSKQGSLF